VKGGLFLRVIAAMCWPSSLSGMNIPWDHFVNQYESSRYIATADGRDNRHIQLSENLPVWSPCSRFVGPGFLSLSAKVNDAK
jgi:hypothetical protein